MSNRHAAVAAGAVAVVGAVVGAAAVVRIGVPRTNAVGHQKGLPMGYTWGPRPSKSRRFLRSSIHSSVKKEK